MTIRRSRNVLLCTALLGVAVTACTSAADTTTGTKGVALSEKEIPSFTFALSSAPTSLDTTFINQVTTTGTVTPLVAEPLERLSEDGTFTPNLASKVSQPDATTIVYQLRSGVRFSDGKAMTAEDVAWSLEHVAKPPAQSSASLQGSFKSATVTGPREVTVKLTTGYPAARTALAMVGLVQEAAFAKAHKSDLGTTKAAPVGTGPYTVTSASSSGITLARNDSYWGTKPKVKKLTFQVVPDDNSAQLAARSGSVNGRLLTNPKTVAQWRAIQGTTVYSSPSSTNNFLAMDVQAAPFDDIHVRKAIAYATDVPGLIKAAWGGEATPMKGFVLAANLANVAGGTKPAQTFLDSLPQHSFDLDKAKAELAKSAHPKGFSTTVLYYSNSPAAKVIVLSLQQNLKELGITINAKPVTENAWGAQFFQHKLTGLILGIGFGSSAPDPAPLLGNFVGEKNIGPQKLNIANWTTPAVEKAQPKVTTAGTSDVRWTASKTILSQIADQVPYVPIASDNWLVATGKGFGASTTNLPLSDFVNGSWIFHIRAAR